MANLNLSRVFLALALLFPQLALAYPDAIRHGYANCTTCHFSPGGGGLLTQYGRSVSREVFSTWGYENEEQPLHGLVKFPEWLGTQIVVGGELRYIRVKRSNVTEAESFLMQAQPRLGLQYKNFKVAAAIGEIKNPRTSEKIELALPEIYGIYSARDDLHFRIGRFQPVYGLRLPDHQLFVRADRKSVV